MVSSKHSAQYRHLFPEIITNQNSGIISNYPDRVFYVGAEYGMEVGIKTNRPHPQCLKNASIKI